MNLTPCRVYSQVYRGSFPKVELFSLSFHHPKGMQFTSGPSNFSFVIIVVNYYLLVVLSYCCQF